jgi:glycosyltransferase involved in cell wall biosynthesis
VKISSFTIITPCRNAERFIRRTVESIFRQSAVESGRINLQYIVCDGASTDGTLATVRDLCGERAEIFSEPDAGMYDALANGFRRATGEVVAYLNAGDFYHPGAFDAVADVFETGISWLTGMNFVCNDRQQPIYCLLPYRYRRRLIARGVYGRILPMFIQQESTFWSRSLLEAVDYSRLASFRLAGDFYLWKCFSTRTDLAIVDTVLGAFVQHPGQQSEAIAQYHAEMDAVRDPARAFDALVGHLDLAFATFLPAKIKKKLNPRLLFRWDEHLRRWS